MNIFSIDLLNQYAVDILIGQITLEFDSSRIFRMKWMTMNSLVIILIIVSLIKI